MNLLKLELGDRSGDGHGQHEDVLFWSNLTREEIDAAYEAAVKRTGIALHTICEEYEDQGVSDDIQAQLLAYDIAFADPEFVSRKDYAKVWFKFVSLTASDAEFVVVIPDTVCQKRAFGYGLFA